MTDLMRIEVDLDAETVEQVDDLVDEVRLIDGVPSDVERSTVLRWLVERTLDQADPAAVAEGSA
jgi:hypothetical protein